MNLRSTPSGPQLIILPQQLHPFCFDDLHVTTTWRSFRPQANNAYIFPPIGHAASIGAWKTIPDDAFLLAAEVWGSVGECGEVLGLIWKEACEALRTNWPME